MTSTKLKIVAQGSSINGVDTNSIPALAAWVKDLWTESFDFEPYDWAKTYDPCQHIIWVDQYDLTGWEQPFVDRGFKIIRDYVWDSAIDQGPEIVDRTLYLRAKEWIWIHEHLLYTHLGLQNLVVNRNPDHFMLLLMNLIRPHRDQLLEECRPYLSTSLYSYVERGIYIAGDVYIPHPNHNGNGNDRYFNPDWYSKTSFSLVCETMVNSRLFVSEKSFKPLAFKHPFIINGTPGTLAYLRSLGFETFNHLIDETYDVIDNTNINHKLVFWLPNGSNADRLRHIMMVVDQLYHEFRAGNQLFTDAESLAKIEHNNHLFFNQQIIRRLWKEQIVDVINNFGCR